MSTYTIIVCLPPLCLPLLFPFTTCGHLEVENNTTTVSTQGSRTPFSYAWPLCSYKTPHFFPFSFLHLPHSKPKSPWPNSTHVLFFLKPPLFFNNFFVFELCHQVVLRSGFEVPTPWRQGVFWWARECYEDTCLLPVGVHLWTRRNLYLEMLFYFLDMIVWRPKFYVKYLASKHNTERTNILYFMAGLRMENWDWEFVGLKIY